MEKKLFWEAFFVISSVPAITCSKLATEAQEYKVWKQFKIKNEDTNGVNSVILVSLLLTLKLFQSLLQLLNLNRQTFAGFILKIQTLMKVRSGISCVML